jgi:hypothetical protein
MHIICRRKMESTKSDGNGMPYVHMGVNGVYRGEIKNGIPHGVGEFVCNDENENDVIIRTEGIWDDGVLIRGTRHQGDKWVFTGFFHATGNEKEGNIKFRNGVEFDGTFHDEGDFKYGRMKNFGHDRTGYYVGEFFNGKRGGAGELFVAGTLYKGNWAEDKLEGEGTMITRKPNIEASGIWHDNHLTGSVRYNNGTTCHFVGAINSFGDHVAGDGKITMPHGLVYHGKFKDNMPMEFGSIAWLKHAVELPVFSHEFHSFCIVSPKQYRQLIQAKVLEELEDPISLEVIGANTPKFHLLHFGLKLDQTTHIQLWHPVDIHVAASMELNTCPLCRLDYPIPLMGWIAREARKVQMNAATKIQRFVRSSRNKSRIKKRASAATKIQRFVRSRRNQKHESHHGGTKRSERKSKRTAKRC